MSHIVDLLEDALDQAKRGEITGLAIVMSDNNRRTLAGYVEGDHVQQLEAGMIHLMHKARTDPPYELDDEFPSRKIRAIS